MAAKEEAPAKHPPLLSGADNMEEEATSWRREVDRNLNRLHSLQFGADLAMQKNDPASAEVLNLRLLGFLHSNLHTEADEAFIRPIIRETVSKINVARGLLIPESDRRAFEQAGKSPGPVFGIKRDLDIENFKNSKYFSSILKQSECGTVKADKADNHDKLNRKISKVMVQAKLTSLYGNSILRSNDNLDKSSLNTKSDNSEDCVILERSQSYQKHHRSSRVFTSPKIEEERICLRARRGHLEIRNTENDIMKSPFNNNETNIDNPGNGFVTAKTQLEKDARQKLGLAGSSSASPQCDKNCTNKGYGVKSYGFPRRGIRGNFIPPIRSNEGNTGNMTSRNTGKHDDSIDDSIKRCLEVLCGPDGELPEKLRNLEPHLIEKVSNEIMDRDPNVRWKDIAGLEHAKKCVIEMVVWPLLRPDIFQGCRSPGKGLLLFGPPGTGKTMIGKAIAGEAKATFFYISASSLTSKWIGEGEKLVRALFGVASCRQPAVIFVDEIDSLLSQRKSEGEHESSRRLKTQFLIEMEGFDSGSEQILLIGATNRPQELDEAARRRLTKRLYIPLPSEEARAWIIRNLLEKDGLFKLSQEDINAICVLTEGYSGSDMQNLVKDASMGPLRDALKAGIEITMLKKEDMRPVTLQDFKASVHEVRASVSSSELGTYEQWNKQFGSIAL